MNICIPVEADTGMGSQVCAHFGSAPEFMIVDTDTETCRAIANTHQHHGHGMCMPLQVLRGQPIDAVVVGGIGKGALGKLRAANIQVYFADQAIVGDVVRAFKAGMLTLMKPGMACAHHRHGHS